MSVPSAAATTSWILYKRDGYGREMRRTLQNITQTSLHQTQQPLDRFPKRTGVARARGSDTNGFVRKAAAVLHSKSGR